MTSRVPRSDSAPVRSGICSNPSSQTPWWTRVDRMVSVRGTPVPAPAWVAMVDPTANRVSGSSVWSWTVTSPRSPCGLPIRATTTSSPLPGTLTG